MENKDTIKRFIEGRYNIIMGKSSVSKSSISILEKLEMELGEENNKPTMILCIGLVPNNIFMN